MLASPLPRFVSAVLMVLISEVVAEIVELHNEAL
jgi:hypothetical protein